ncbi:hypothetical protein F7725_005014 [Dissostichus mawsoni]|uniref:L-amino-acid oxidase n=1 Tax=Dissostichus mawsoni TaxID=36200 RepID=A0A7J5XKN3_DISMA|nr:hypothetical protein F7725_005014 [Dissostichus mawsoni]
MYKVTIVESSGRVGGRLKNTYAVKADPNILKYNVRKSEKGKSANDLLQRALQRVKDDVKAHGCKVALQKYDQYSLEDYLNGEDVSPEAIRMIGDLLNQESLMNLALTEVIYLQSDVNNTIKYYEVTNGSDLLTTAFQNVLKDHVPSSSTLRTPLTHLHADLVLVTTTAKAALFMDFDPPLSSKKMEVLRGIHYGSSTKIILTFKEKFWLEDGIKGGKSITDGPSRFIYYPSHSFPNNKIGKWSTDPHSLGAFALFTPYQHLILQGAVQKEGRVHFAGEHTAFPHAWIETAMKSAIRAATNINKEAARTQQHDEL